MLATSLRMLSLAFCLVATSLASAQSFDPMSVLRKDVGSWDCDLRFYADPKGQPSISHAVETNYMVGNVWMVGDFKGEMAGTSFHGSSQMGYDPKRKKYIGSWIDSASPYPTAMEGTYDPSKKTLTITGIGKDPNGGETKMQLVTVYQEDDTRTMTMYIGAGGDQWQRIMEVDYRRKK